MTEDLGRGVIECGDNFYPFQLERVRGRLRRRYLKTAPPSNAPRRVFMEVPDEVEPRRASTAWPG